MKIEILNKRNLDSCLLNVDVIDKLNDVVLSGMIETKTTINKCYSNQTLGCCLKDNISKKIKDLDIFATRKYYNSIYFIKDEYIFLYKRNSKYITKNTRISIKNFVDGYNKSMKQLDFDFGDNNPKNKLNDKKCFLLLLDFDISNLRDELEEIYYRLYYITVENEEIVSYIDITNNTNCISKAHDISNNKNTDKESEIPILKRVQKEVTINND